MNALTDIQPNAAIGVEVLDGPEALSAIKAPGCAASIWRRAFSPEFHTWIEGLDEDRLPAIRTITRADAVRPALEEAAEESGTPQGPELKELIDDITALAAEFTSQMETPYLRLRLDVVTSNSCRKFHIDAVTARLICTYRGTGTQYGAATGDGDPEVITTVPTGSPILLRGTKWPVQPKSGLLHRSPPIEGSGETRLLLVLDPIQDWEEG